MKLPRSTRIGSLDYRIKSCPVGSIDKGKTRGEICLDRRLIKVERGPAAVMANTLLHEHLHGIFNDAGLDASPVLAKHEEQIVLTFTSGLMQVIRDNPEIIRFLEESARA